MMFTAKEGVTKYRFVVTAALLDDTCGVEADEKTRKSWVTTHLPEILETRHGAAQISPPFDRITVEEMT